MNRWGWMSPAELIWLGEQAAQMQSVVEIGCLHGRSSVALATACPGTVYCIDPWSDDGFRSWTEGVGNVFPNVVGIREASPAAAARVPAFVDMVFIDGAHDYDSVVADIQAWLPKATKLLCGHDYVPFSALDGNEPGFPDVAVAVHELIGEENITVAPGTAIWAYRPQ
jgi:hypothetical protein